MSRAALPPLYGDPSKWALIQADSLSFLRKLPSDSIDAVVTDPPYGIAMASWDGGAGTKERSKPKGFEAFSKAWATELLRVMKPGGHLIAFGAARTGHRLTSGIEDAGFEIRDSIAWLYGSGMPKARMMKNGQSTVLRPAHEPAVLARKPLAKKKPGKLTAAENIERFGTGALGIDDARIARVGKDSDPLGYWPANVALGHNDTCTGRACSDGCPLPLIDQASASPLSRMFHVAKPSRAEREAGCAGLKKSSAPVFGGGPVRPRANAHPTVKPIELMRWLIRLSVPIGGVVLDPFTGSGSTGCAAALEGRQFVGLEREAQYVEIARARITYWAAQAGGDSWGMTR